MAFNFSKQVSQQLGEVEYTIKEGTGIKLFFFVAGIAMGIGIPISHFIFNISWVYGLSQTEVPDVLLLLLGGFLIFFGLYSLYTTKNKQELELYRYGMIINQQAAYYSDIRTVEIKRNFVVKVIVKTTENQFSYKASKFSHKDQQAMNQIGELVNAYT